MNRREALKSATALLGGVLVTSIALPACVQDSPRPTPGVLSADDEALIEEIADTLLPPTPASPGAKAAAVGPAMNLILTDCYKPDAQQRVVQGLKDFRAVCRGRCGDSFASLPRSEREKLLREIDVEALTVATEHYFPLVRELALGAYFSSEIGLTRALRYVPVPGRYTGCVPLQPGQPAWG
jgi:hypothetical protein